MKLTCGHCQQQVQIDDAKVPTGTFKIKCPKCGKIITAQKEVPAPSVTAPIGEAPPEEPKPEEPSPEEIPPVIQAHLKQELTAMKKELLGAMSTLFGGEMKWPEAGSDAESGDEQQTIGKHALVCEDEQMFIEIISNTLKKLGYSIDVARSTAEAIKKVETGNYQLITVDYIFPDDKEGGNKIIAKINGQKAMQRRQCFVVLISASVKSADASAAFFHGANIVVNKEEIKNLGAHIREGQKRFQEIYHVFNRLITEKEEKF